MNCKQCGKWAGAHATLPGQANDHLCVYMPVPPQHYTVPMSDDRVRLLVREELQRLGLLIVRDPMD